MKLNHLITTLEKRIAELDHHIEAKSKMIERLTESIEKMCAERDEINYILTEI